MGEFWKEAKYTLGIEKRPLIGKGHKISRRDMVTAAALASAGTAVVACAPKTIIPKDSTKSHDVPFPTEKARINKAKIEAIKNDLRTIDSFGYNSEGEKQIDVSYIQFDPPELNLEELNVNTPIMLAQDRNIHLVHIGEPISEVNTDLLHSYLSEVFAEILQILRVRGVQINDNEYQQIAQHILRTRISFSFYYVTDVPRIVPVPFAFTEFQNQDVAENVARNALLAGNVETLYSPAYGMPFDDSLEIGLNHDGRTAGGATAINRATGETSILISFDVAGLIRDEGRLFETLLPEDYIKAAMNNELAHVVTSAIKNDIALQHILHDFGQIVQVSNIDTLDEMLTSIVHLRYLRRVLENRLAELE